VRNYQIIDKSDTNAISGNAKKTNESQLVEVGPRFVLIPIRIFNGSLCGATLYQNPAFVSPNDERSAYKKKKGYAIFYFLTLASRPHVALSHQLFNQFLKCDAFPPKKHYLAEIAMCREPRTPRSAGNSCKKTRCRPTSFPAKTCSNKRFYGWSALVLRVHVHGLCCYWSGCGVYNVLVHFS